MTAITTAITGFRYEIGLLKRYSRTGWLQLGVRTPESVADHSFRVSVAASVIASLEGADPQRAAFLARWHDSQETRQLGAEALAQPPPGLDRAHPPRTSGALSAHRTQGAPAFRTRI